MTAKTCLEKVGLFKEMSYLHHSPGWTSAKADKIGKKSATKGKQMLAGGYKSVGANMDGYFDQQFIRGFTGEAWASQAATEKLLQQRIKSHGNQIAEQDWIPNSGAKFPNGLGTFYGTFSKQIPAVSALNKSRPPEARHELPNCKTNPAQKGVGWGYANVALSRYPEYMFSPYHSEQQLSKNKRFQHNQKIIAGPMKLNSHPVDYFEPNPYAEKGPPKSTYKYSVPVRRILVPFRAAGPAKWDGGCKDGCLNKFPVYMADNYNKKAKYQQNVTNTSGETYYPSAGPKSVRSPGIINTNVDISAPGKSARGLKSVVYKDSCARSVNQEREAVPGTAI